MITITQQKAQNSRMTGRRYKHFWGKIAIGHLFLCKFYLSKKRWSNLPLMSIFFLLIEYICIKKNCLEFPAFSNMYLGSDFLIRFCYCCDKCILFLVSLYNSSMEDHAFRFPHLASNFFDQLDNQSLVNCKEASRKLDNFFGNEKFF